MCSGKPKKKLLLESVVSNQVKNTELQLMDLSKRNMDVVNFSALL